MARLENNRPSHLRRTLPIPSDNHLTKEVKLCCRVSEAFFFFVFPSPPFDVAFRLSLRIFVVSVRVGALAPVLFILFCFTGTYPRPFRWPPAWFMSLRELVFSPLAGLFYFGLLIIICFVLFLLARIPVPLSDHLPAPLYREAGGARIPIFTFICVIFYFLTSHSV